MQYGIEASADEAFAIAPRIGADAISRPRTRRPSALQALARLPLLWWRRFQDRCELAGLDDRMLQDMGLSRSEAWHESSKRFWQE